MRIKINVGEFWIMLPSFPHDGCLLLQHNVNEHQHAILHADYSFFLILILLSSSARWCSALLFSALLCSRSRLPLSTSSPFLHWSCRWPWAAAAASQSMCQTRIAGRREYRHMPFHHTQSVLSSRSVCPRLSPLSLSLSLFSSVESVANQPYVWVNIAR